MSVIKAYTRKRNLERLTDLFFAGDDVHTLQVFKEILLDQEERIAKLEALIIIGDKT